MSYVVDSKSDGCIFCLKAEQEKDTDNHILYRARHNFVILNAYPYNSGHLMVVPYQHVSCITELDSAALREMFLIAQGCVEVMSDYLRAEGVNIGINIGEAAGAGIEQHLHLHVVPRWHGDTNYMTSVGETRVVPQDLNETYAGLQPVLEEALAEKLSQLGGD